PQPAGSAAALDLTTSKAIWIDRDTVAWNGVDQVCDPELPATFMRVGEDRYRRPQGLPDPDHLQPGDGAAPFDPLPA
ncbi:hypothetical protein ABZ372_47380, partial [Streptomyces sp. NPDC005921]